MMKNEAGVRIEEMLCQLADATRIDGEIWRAAYTLEDKIAKNILREWIEDLGLEYREDAIGNVYGRLPGTEPGTILTGSHLDTVKNGGKYDGALGVVTGVAALGYLKQSGFVPKHSLEVGGLMEEEGSRFPSGCQGSRAICGTLKEEDLEELSRDGVTLREALVSAGYQTEALKNVKRDDIRAIVELHIEQGADLEERGLTCGAVTAIVGYDRLFLTLHGEANHAGTTSMRRRRDALAAAAEVILGVKELAEADDRFVATVGQLNVAPNAVNIVPGKVQLAIETRAADDRVLAEVRAKIMSLLERTASKSGVVITKENDFHVAAVPLSESVRKVIEQSAAECGVSFQAMPSWAGHDAQIFAASGVPTGMIFVPSINGVSHSKEESSDFQSVTQAVKVLEKTLKTLAEV